MKVDMAALREDLAKEMKRVGYIINEHDMLQKECNSKFPILEARMNINETRRHEMERELMSINDRIPENSEVLLRTLQEISEKTRRKAESDEKRLSALEADTRMLKKKQNLAELE